MNENSKSKNINELKNMNKYNTKNNRTKVTVF